MGGLIIRAALPHLDKYKDIMYSFVTFSTPHLGNNIGSKLILGGIYAIKQINKSMALN